MKRYPETLAENTEELMSWRNTTQALLPVHAAKEDQNTYDMYPLHAVGEGIIHEGYASLAAWIAGKKIVLVDGATGVFWDEVKAMIAKELFVRCIKVSWHSTADFLKSEAERSDIIAPFTGAENEVWGKRATFELKDLFDLKKLESTSFASAEGLHIVFGPGAILVDDKAPVIYLELSKTELQYRMRAGSSCNLFSSRGDSQTSMYKRFYFVDWIIVNHHKNEYRERINILADVQWKETLTWLLTPDLKAALKQLVAAPFRVRPWFEAGAWGGQWMKEHIAGINKEEINYAWSFELIVPENGVILQSNNTLFELPFEWLMYYQHEAILGKHAPVFGYEFPIRFDFLDTFDGGNLSIQCHPALEYIRRQFGETITQDETYYILDCREGAGVYLGFCDDINEGSLRAELEYSKETGDPIDIAKSVQLHPAKKHDLFLIPNGTVHSAGAGNMVLEISATPYIFTFKMYDWVRPGLDGKPRAINLDHAFNNLDFTRKGAAARQLISKPALLDKGADWQLFHLPTHEAHFYDVHRLEFDSIVEFDTTGYCYVMMLVEGTSISVTTPAGGSTIYHYAETFVLPAAAVVCQMRNLGKERAKLIKAFIKPEHPIFEGLPIL